MKKLSRYGAALVLSAALSSAALAIPAGAAPTKPSVPGKPTITKVTPGFHSVKVEFTKPDSNGGAKIVNYRVLCTSRDKRARAANEGPKSPIKVSGLTTGKTYSCTVKAKNRVGYGPASDPSAPFQPLPKAPK
jgi:extracellular elastinolytic metalloproteinase